MMTTLSARDESFFLYCPCLYLFPLWRWMPLPFPALNQFGLSYLEENDTLTWVLCVFILDSVCIWHVSWEQVSHLSKTAHCSAFSCQLLNSKWGREELPNNPMSSLSHVPPISHFIHSFLWPPPASLHLSNTVPAPKFDMLATDMQSTNVELICSC